MVDMPVIRRLKTFFPGQLRLAGETGKGDEKTPVQPVFFIILTGG